MDGCEGRASEAHLACTWTTSSFRVNGLMLNWKYLFVRTSERAVLALELNSKSLESMVFKSAPYSMDYIFRKKNFTKASTSF